jgi:hypothetical protein
MSNINPNDSSFAFQNLVFPDYYREVTSFLNNIQGSSYLHKFNNYITSAGDENQAFLYFYKSLGVAYYKRYFNNDPKINMNSPSVNKKASQFNVFRNDVVDNYQDKWYEMSKSILGQMDLLGFTNIFTSKWRSKLESVAAGFASTENQCSMVLGPDSDQNGVSVCSFCNLEFTHETRGCLISCEHVLEIGLLTFLLGLTPRILNDKKTPESIKRAVVAYFQSLNSYKWACQRCNMIKSNIQTTRIKNNISSIFISFEENGFEVNTTVVTEFCQRILDKNRGSSYIVKCPEHVDNINELMKNRQWLYNHMVDDIIQPLVDALNETLHKYYGNTRGEQLASMFSIGLIRWSILDLQLKNEKVQIRGGGYKQMKGGDGLIQPNFTSNQGLMNFITTILYNQNQQEKLGYMLENFENFSYSFNIFIQSLIDNFDMLNGLSKNIATINLEKGYLEDNVIEEKLNLEWEQFNLISSELLNSLCLYSNFETIITILNFYFNQQDGVALLNAFNTALYNYGISGTQIYTNLVNDYQQSVQNIQIGNFFILFNNEYLQINNQNIAFIVYNIDSYFFILNTEIMLLGKFVSEEGDDFGENNIVAMILNSTQPNVIGPGINITLTPLEKDTSTNFNIKDVSLKICPGQLIILVNNNNNFSIAFQGGKKTKPINKRKFNKSNRFNKTNKKQQKKTQQRKKRSYKKK